MAFVTNSTSPFNLGVEEIIYLNDIGIPGSIVNAMMQRDQALKGLPANTGPMLAAPASVAPANPSAPAPGTPASYAPQPAEPPAAPEMVPEAPPSGDYAAEGYPPPPATDTGYSTFYDSLTPYGTWVDVAGYGPCWQPTVVVANPMWRPYCDAGRWVYTDCGWYWLSGYSWGWAPFHYGRWFQHNHLGWCWTPDTVWGPSWVCWRYGSTQCGWAPLPPAARYRPGIGLTYHGHAVSGSFGFGLGVKSFAFVDVNHFRDQHLNRHALPPQQAAQVYSRTVASATIVGHNNRVINSGIPVGRVEAATQTQIHPIAIREASAPAAQGARNERFEGSSRTMSVTRPHFPASTGAQPAPSGRPRSELRNGGSVPAAASTSPGVTRASSAPAVGGAPTARPNSTVHFITKAERPVTATGATATTATGSARPMSTMRSDPPPRSATPLVLHGPDRPGHYTAGSSVGASKAASPPNTPVVIGSQEVHQQRPMRQSSAWTTETPQAQPTQRAAPARSEVTWSAPRPAAPPASTSPQRQYTAPSYHAQPPAETWRSTPAPAPAPQPAHSYSPPPPSFTPRAPAVESHPAYSAPAAPAASAPAPQSHSSSDRKGR